METKTAAQGTGPRGRRYKLAGRKVLEMICVLCRKERDQLTDEHILPIALGGNLYLSQSTCTECQRACNQSFEQRFLKGTNFVALLRATLGLRGRGEEPIYGFDNHGEPLLVAVQSGFPQVRVGFGHNRVDMPPQVILRDANNKSLAWYPLPETIQKPITAALFSALIAALPSGTTTAALWVDGDSVAVNAWRQLVDAFVAWTDSNGITALVSCAPFGAPEVNLTLEHNSLVVTRGLAKIALFYALYRPSPTDRLSDLLQEARNFVLLGDVAPCDLPQHLGPVRQWNGPDPTANILDGTPYTYLLATVAISDALWSLVRLHNLGLYAVRLARNVVGDSDFIPQTLTTYLLEHHEHQRPTLRETVHPEATVLRLAEAVRENPGALA